MGDDNQGEVLVFAAASLSDSLLEVGRLFEDESGLRVSFNFAGSNALAQQILASPAADIFLSADGRWMDFVERHGRIDPETRRDLLTNRLAIICSRETDWPLVEVADLADLDFAFLCVGDPSAVPVGRYARQWLEQVESRDGGSLWDRLKDRVSPAPDAKAALAQTLSRKDAIGIVYTTDLISAKQDARVLAETETEIARLPIALTRSGIDNQAAGAFFRFIQSTAAEAVFERHEFGIAQIQADSE